MIRAAGLIAATLLFGAPLAAEEEDHTAYIEANLLSIFYHEFGHALIDVMDLPIFGQEEDAADTASVLMIDMFNTEEDAQSILFDAALGFLDEDAAANGAEPPWWDVHGPDLQRFYNMVCQFYGGYPSERETLADELGLPPERAETCEEEFALAYDSFEPVFTELFAAAPGTSITFEGAQDSLSARIIAAEVESFNKVMALPTPITVTVKNCGEANAFYDPGAREITMCLEYEDHLRALAQTF